MSNCILRNMVHKNGLLFFIHKDKDQPSTLQSQKLKKDDVITTEKVFKTTMRKKSLKS